LNQHHFEFCPKYRRKCFKNPVKAKEMKEIMESISRDKGILIHNIVVDSDHVHLFVSLPFSMSVSTAVNLLKGISAYRFFRLHPNFRKLYPKGHFWSPGHFSRSISNVTSGAIQQYIECHDFAKLNETVHSIHEEPRQLGLMGFF